MNTRERMRLRAWNLAHPDKRLTKRERMQGVKDRASIMLWMRKNGMMENGVAWVEW